MKIESDRKQLMQGQALLSSILCVLLAVSFGVAGWLGYQNFLYKNKVTQLEKTISDLDAQNAQRIEAEAKIRDRVMTETKAAVLKRHAVSLIAIHSAGKAAGIEWAGHSKSEVVKSVIKGQTPGFGIFETTVFKYPLEADIILSDLLIYIKKSGENLEYDKLGNQSDEP